MNAVRAGRIVRVDGGGDWVVRFLRNKILDRKLMLTDRSLVNIARDVAITSSGFEENSCNTARGL